MARTMRKKISWKVDRSKDAPRQKNTYVPDAPIDEPLAALLENQLVVGNMFIVSRNLGVYEANPYLEPPPYPYVFEDWGGSPRVVARQGSVAVYAGTVRVEESKGSTNVRVLRHSFIIHGSRYLTSNLNFFLPASEQPSD